MLAAKTVAAPTKTPRATPVLTARTSSPPLEHDRQ